MLLSLSVKNNSSKVTSREFLIFNYLEAQQANPAFCEADISQLHQNAVTCDHFVSGGRHLGCGKSRKLFVHLIYFFCNKNCFSICCL